MARIGQSRALLHPAQSGVAGIRPVCQSGRPAGGTHRLRRLPCVDRAAGAEEHDDPRLHALERRSLQQRLDPQQAVGLRRELQHARQGAAAADCAAADRARDEFRGGGGRPRSAASVRAVAAQQHPTNFRTRRPLPSGVGQPRASRGKRPAADAAEQPGARHRKPHRPGVLKSHQNSAARPHPEFLGHKRPPRRLPL